MPSALAQRLGLEALGSLGGVDRPTHEAGPDPACEPPISGALGTRGACGGGEALGCCVGGMWLF